MQAAVSPPPPALSLFSRWNAAFSSPQFVKFCVLWTLHNYFSLVTRLERLEKACKGTRRGAHIRELQEKTVCRRAASSVRPFHLPLLSLFAQFFLLTALASPAVLCPRGVAAKCGTRAPPMERGVAATVAAAAAAAAALLSDEWCVSEQLNGNISPCGGAAAALSIPPAPPCRCCWCLSAVMVSTTAFSLSSMCFL